MGGAGLSRAEPGRRQGGQKEGIIIVRDLSWGLNPGHCGQFSILAAPSQGRYRVLLRCPGTSGTKVEETGEPGQEKQDARPRCPPLRFEEGVVGWKMGVQRLGLGNWRRTLPPCRGGVGGLRDPSKRGAAGYRGVGYPSSASSLASEMPLARSRASKPPALGTGLTCSLLEQCKA